MGGATYSEAVDGHEESEEGGTATAEATATVVAIAEVKPVDVPVPAEEKVIVTDEPPTAA